MSSSFYSRLILSLFLLSSLSGCIFDAVTVEKPEGDNNPTNPPVYNYVLKVDAVLGTQDVLNAATKIQLANQGSNALPAGVTIQARTYRVSNLTPPAFANVVLDGSNQFQPNLPSKIGRYKTEVRVLQGATLLATAEATYYVHASLNGVPKCPEYATNQAYFTAAAAALPDGGQFAYKRFDKAPFYEFKLNATTGNNTLYKIASLRRGFVVSPDGKLVLIRRIRASQMRGDCNFGIHMVKHRAWNNAGENNFANTYYDVVVFNAKGEYVGFSGHNTTVAHMNSNFIHRLGQQGQDFGSSVPMRPFRPKTFTYSGTDPVNFSDFANSDHQLMVNE